MTPQTLSQSNYDTALYQYLSKSVESRIIGPTLGQDSLNKSMIAGLIGLVIVMLFMAIYYRLPGLVADVIHYYLRDPDFGNLQTNSCHT